MRLFFLIFIVKGKPSKKEESEKKMMIINFDSTAYKLEKVPVRPKPKDGFFRAYIFVYDFAETFLVEIPDSFDFLIKQIKKAPTGIITADYDFYNYDLLLTTLQNFRKTEEENKI